MVIAENSCHKFVCDNPLHGSDDHVFQYSIQQGLDLSLNMWCISFKVFMLPYWTDLPVICSHGCELLVFICMSECLVGDSDARLTHTHGVNICTWSAVENGPETGQLVKNVSDRQCSVATCLTYGIFNNGFVTGLRLLTLVWKSVRIWQSYKRTMSPFWLTAATGLVFLSQPIFLVTVFSTDCIWR